MGRIKKGRSLDNLVLHLLDDFAVFALLARLLECFLEGGDLAPSIFFQEGVVLGEMSLIQLASVGSKSVSARGQGVAIRG